MATLAQHSSLHGISVRDIVYRTVSTLQHWITVSHQRRELAKLDERLLKDIGIDPEMARLEACKPFWK